MRHPSLPMRRLALPTTLALACLSAVGVPAAVGGSGLKVTVDNQLPRAGVAGYPQVSLAEPGDSRFYCWYTNDLAFTNRTANAVGQGGKRSFYTEVKQGGAPCLTDFGDKARIDLGVYVKVAPGRDWIKVITDEPDRSMRIRFEKQGSICNWNDNLDYCFVVRNSLPTFAVPTSDLPGLMCWSVRSTADNNTLRNQNGEITFTMRADDWCNTPRGRTIYPSRSGAPVYGDPAPPEEKFPVRQANAGTAVANQREAQAPADPAEPDDPGKDEGTIVSFMSSAGVGCQMLGIFSDDKQCADVAKNELSNLSGLSTDVRKFKVTGSFATVTERKNICSSTQTIPVGAGVGQVTCRETFQQESATTHTTQHGWKVGFGYKKTFKYNANLVFSAIESQHEISVSGEYNGSITDAVTSRKSETREVSVQQQALPGMVTKMDVFTQSADANYTFDADLTMGLPGADQAVQTPAARVLGMSPSDIQHCLGYVVGGSRVNGSIMERQKRLLDSGLNPGNPSLPRAHQLFLQSAPFYSVGSTACPGMPSMFPATASFKGRGVGTYASAGYGDDGKPLKTWTVCVYTMPLPGSRAAERGDAPRGETQSSPSSPCVVQKSTGPDVQVRRPGTLVNLNTLPGESGLGGRSYTGVAGSENLVGTPRADTVALDAGVAQVVRSGGGDDVIDALRGNDYIEAGPGNDTVRAGSHDTVSGGTGADALSATSARRTLLAGDAGDDNLDARDVSRTSLSGGTGADRLSLSGTIDRVVMAGGPGNDTYVIGATSGPAPRLFEMPNQGDDVVETDRSVTVPLYIERVRVTGAAAADVRSGDDTQIITGSDGPNVISPGRGADIVDAGGGSDVVQMMWDAHDTVAGGPDADLFVPLGTPATARNGGLMPGASAHRITDFAPAEGDRIQLRARVFGASVANLGRAWQVVVQPAPVATSPGATILADPTSGLLAFDRDGSGPVIPKVIAVVPNAGEVTASWFTLG